ncbi:hypothetical protein QLQ12_27100 [Actinoplanes sp. NEAU-A12]|uniref:Secreted protein n=1 Tax=Actinoplanes sandaracinus TaxID=3045177 RepID=A0ABT6WRI1_9ACTN|nr:hypothetical protein [Actinoplanes sandaracinus]MDI6102291.1 hypothetical protein [Actinoplanes sandaracinus]
MERLTGEHERDHRMEQRYRGVHTRRALHRRRTHRRGWLAVAALSLLGAAALGAAESRARTSAEGAAQVATPAGVFAAAPAAPTSTYDAAAYRQALEDDIGYELSDTGFAEIEEVAERICGWDREEFAGWVAVNADDGTLADVHLDVTYRCPHRDPEIAEALRVIAEARKSCEMPGLDDPEVTAMIAGRPAQAALTCVLLTKPITAG